VDDEPAALARGWGMTDSRRIDWKRADPPRRPVLFVNPRSGGGAGPRIAEHAEKRGITVNEFAPDQSLAALVDEAVVGGADALAVAGGDGSLATVAAAALARDLPFACVPAGTRNHFARDLGLDPADPSGALDALSDGIEGRIDLGEVNGRLFLNCVSLGIYAEAVRQSGYRDAKVRTLLETARVVLGPGAELSQLHLLDDLGARHADPAIVIVSNNPYALGGQFASGARPTLSGGRLGIIVIDGPGARTRPLGRAWSAPSLRVDASERTHAGLDGEAVELSPPLEFTIRPVALRVRMPRGVRSAGGSARARRRPAAPARHR
jgi:diacylglycerol kinase family enzyme